MHKYDTMKAILLVNYHAQQRKELFIVLIGICIKLYGAINSEYIAFLWLPKVFFVQIIFFFLIKLWTICRKSCLATVIRQGQCVTQPWFCFLGFKNILIIPDSMNFHINFILTFQLLPK